MLLHLFPFPSIVIFTSCFGVSNSFPCFILLGVSGYLQPHHPLSFIYLPCLSDFVFPPFPHFLPFKFNVQWHDLAVFLLHLYKLKNAWTRRSKEEKKGREAKVIMSLSLLKKKSKYLVFNLIFLLDYCCMKGLDKQQNQEKLKSHQSGMAAANAEWTVIFGRIKINTTSFQL